MNEYKVYDFETGEEIPLIDLVKSCPEFAVIRLNQLYEKSERLEKECIEKDEEIKNLEIQLSNAEDECQYGDHS